MTPLQTLLHSARHSDICVALSEGEDPRVIKAALAARRQDLARIILVGRHAEIEERLRKEASLDDGLTIFDPETDPAVPNLVKGYRELRAHKGISQQDASQAVRQPHVAAALLVKTGRADGTLGGAVTTTADIVRTALQVIGTAPGDKMVSSFFLMVLKPPSVPTERAIVFSDAGLVVNPSPVQLSQIALASAASFSALTGNEPQVAMLSFSTIGSAHHPAVTKVVEATSLVRAANPDLKVGGELQFDAAFVPEVGASKAPGSDVAGKANVFIFPNLDAGNIGYKIAQRIGGADAIGPILQGLARPANDLSRGCSAQDILHMIAVTAIQAKAGAEA